MPTSFSDDHFVATKRERRPRAWAWEIQRRFESEFDAKLAGKEALRSFSTAWRKTKMAERHIGLTVPDKLLATAKPTYKAEPTSWLIVSFEGYSGHGLSAA